MVLLAGVLGSHGSREWVTRMTSLTPFHILAIAGPPSHPLTFLRLTQLVVATGGS